MAVPTAPSAGITCPICLTVSTLPETLPFGEDPCCGLCLNTLRRYLPCVACERSFDPQLPACPTCGERPPDAALTNPAWRIPNRVLAEALAALRQPAPAPASTPPTKQAASVPKRNGNGNGTGRTASKRAGADDDLPEVTPKVFGNGNGHAAPA
ncbi:MAG: hypothetical protein ACRDG4_16345, partial [Chloroflexota bacterium]